MNEFINFQPFIIPKEYEVKFFNNVVTIYYYFSIIVLTLTTLPFSKAAFYGKFQVTVTTLNLPGKLGWFLMELASPAMFIYSFLVPSPFDDHNNSYTITQKILATLYLIHYFNRTFIYTYRAPRIAPVHLSVFISSTLFNLVNSYCNGRWISVFGDYPEKTYKEPLFIAGVIIFFIGMWINIKHDNILFELRVKNSPTISSEKKSDNKNDLNDIKKKYFIPNEGLFNYISCPSYLGETIEWIGFAIACWYSLPSLIFVIITIANLFHRAKQTLRWYRENFEDYPKERKAIIPFIF